MKSLYIAGPLFNESERSFNLRIKNLMSKYFDVYLPQEDGGLMTAMINEGCSLQFASRYVFNQDIEAINNADCLLIILDGRTIDEGAAFELGYSYANGKTCVAYQSDSRRLLPCGNNPMISNAVSEIFSNEEELIKWAKSFLGIEENRIYHADI